MRAFLRPLLLAALGALSIGASGCYASYYRRPYGYGGSGYYQAHPYERRAQIREWHEHPVYVAP